MRVADRQEIRKRLSPEDRAAQLMAVALELFGQEGLGRVGHGDIAKQAGVSTGTVFNYFPTIDGLNARVMEAVHLSTMAIFNIDQPQARLSPILSFGRRLLDIVESHPDLSKIFLSWSHSYGEPFRAEFLALKGEILRQIEDSLPPRDNAAVDAQIIFGTGIMLAQMKLEGAGDEELNPFLARVANLIG